MANEDFTTYTESDADGVLSQTTTKATFTNADYHADTYLYKDYGVAHFNASFRFNLDFRATAIASSLSTYNLFGLSNYLGTQNALDNANRPFLGVGIQDWNNGTQKYPFLLFEQKPGGSGFYYDYSTFSFDLNTTYYLQIFYDSTVGTYGTIYCYVYSSDADRTAGTNVIDTMTVTLHEAPSFRYLYAFQIYTNNGATTNDVSGYVENLNLSALSNKTYDGSDTINASEVMTGLRSIISAISDTINASEVMTVLKGLGAVFVDTITMTETLLIERTWAFISSETINVTEVLKGDLETTIQDVINATEDLLAIAGKIFTAIENINVSEVMTGLRARISEVSDDIGITEAMTNFRGLFASLSETINLTETMTAVLGRVINVVDNISVTSSIVFNWLKVLVKPILNTIRLVKPKINKIDK